MLHSTQTAFGTKAACWHTRPSSGSALACDRDALSLLLSTAASLPPPAGPIYVTLPEMKAEMQRYGHYEVLVVDSVLKIVSSTLGVIYAIDYMGREYHCRL